MLVRRTITLFRCYSRVRLDRASSHLSSQCGSSAASKAPSTAPSTDALGLPLSPLWSVHDLISSYPSPTLSDATLIHLHTLSALVPPKAGTAEFEQLKHELEDLMKLVAAVRLAPESIDEERNPPDGRVWAAGRDILLDRSSSGQNQRNIPPSGRALLEHAQRTNDGLYLVDSAKSKV